MQIKMRTYIRFFSGYANYQDAAIGTKIVKFNDRTLTVRDGSTTPCRVFVLGEHLRPKTPVQRLGSTAAEDDRFF